MPAPKYLHHIVLAWIEFVASGENASGLNGGLLHIRGGADMSLGIGLRQRRPLLKPSDGGVPVRAPVKRCEPVNEDGWQRRREVIDLIPP